MWFNHYKGDGVVLMIYKTNESLIVIQAEATALKNTGVVFWSHDRGTAKLRFKLQKDGISQSLPEGTNVPIRLMFRSTTAEGGYGKHDYLAAIEDRVNGIVSIVLEDNIMGYVGIVEGSIYIDFPNDQSLDTAGRFSFSIKRSPIDESTPELEDYYFSGFEQINAQLVEIIKKVDEAQQSIKQTVFTAETTINTSKTEATNTINSVASSATSKIEESAENVKTTIQTAAAEVTQAIKENNVYTKNEIDANFVNLTEPQKIEGTKDFSEPPSVNGEAILYGNQLFEGFYGSGTVHSNFKNKARVGVGGLVVDGQPRLSEPFEWNTERWTATVTRDVTFYCKGTMYIDTGGNMGKYIYIANWKDEAQTQYASGNPAGMGIAADNGYWYRNFCDFSFIASLKKGDKFSIGIELAADKEVWNIQLRTLHIKELISPT